MALKHGIDCGGWCPTGRLDEVGVIPARYPVRELISGGFTERTRRNVREADGTVIIYVNELGGGSEQTARFCFDEKRPCLFVDAAKLPAVNGAELIDDFVRDQAIVTLNVAGPRQSEWPEGYDYAYSVIDTLLSRRSHS